MKKVSCSCNTNIPSIEEAEKSGKCLICDNPAFRDNDAEYEDFGPNIFCKECTAFLACVAPLPVEAVMYQFQKKQDREKLRLKNYLVNSGYEFVDESYEDF